MPYHRTGTIAQLPRAIRDRINQMLDDGFRYKAIVAWLDSNGHPGVKVSHIGEWKKGGFQDWLKLDRERSREEKLHELSFKIATANEGSKAHEASIRVATNLLFETFLKYDPDNLAKELDMKKTQITTVLNTFSRISRRTNELDMIKDYKRRQEEQRQDTQSNEAGKGVQNSCNTEVLFCPSHANAKTRASDK